MSTVGSVYDAIAARLKGALWTAVGVGDMTGTLPPFVSVWGDPGGPGDDLPLGACDGIVLEVGVTFTAQLLPVANRMAADGVQALTPMFRPGRVPCEGAVLEMEFDGVFDAVVDRSVTLPSTDSHPSFAVARFRAHITPVPVPEPTEEP